MIYGRLIKPRNKFFHKRSTKKKTYSLTEPNSSLDTPSHPVIKDHVSHHIRSTENAISDLYRSKKPTSLKIQSLGKNLSKLGSLDNARKQNTGVFRISRPPTQQHPQPDPPPRPRKRARVEAEVPDAQAEVPEDEFVVRRLFPYTDLELDEERIREGAQTPVRKPHTRVRRKRAPVRGRKERTPVRVQPGRAARVGHGLLRWKPHIWRMSTLPFLMWKTKQ